MDANDVIDKAMNDNLYEESLHFRASSNFKCKKDCKGSHIAIYVPMQHFLTALITIFFVCCYVK